MSAENHAAAKSDAAMPSPNGADPLVGLKKYLFSNFEQLFVLTILVSVALINYFIPQKLAFLNFYFLPVIMAGYFLGRIRSVMGAVLCITLVAAYVIISPDQFIMDGSRMDLAFHVIAWGGFLILSGAVVGNQREKLVLKIRQTLLLNRRLKKHQTALNLANQALSSTNERLEAMVRERTAGLTREIRRRKGMEETLRKANRALKRLAVKDGLTNIANRRKFEEHLDLEWRRMRREQGPLSLIICDVDMFKKYNDHYGHPAGDTCLKAVAGAIAETAKRAGDLAARYGGEEFALILPNTPAAGAAHMAETIRAAVEALALPHETSGAAPVVTLSLGAAAVVPDGDTCPADLVESADQALYMAKSGGRNRAVLAPPDGDITATAA